MSSPPPSNILLDPLTELTQSLSENAFGISPSSTVLANPEYTFPITPQDKEGVKRESREKGRTMDRVRARCRVGLLEGGVVEVVLDQRGYTIAQLESVPTTEGRSFPHETYESLEALLIAISPAYVEAMAREVGKRLEAVAGGGGEGK